MPHRSRPILIRIVLAIPVWYFMQSASLAHDPSTYTLLPEFITNRLGIDGLESWQSSEGDDPTDRLPQVSLNTRLDNPSVGGLDWPAGTVGVDPLPDRMAVVGWEEPGYRRRQCERRRDRSADHLWRRDRLVDRP